METFIKLYVEKMADAPAKNKAPAKPKKPGAHPKYSETIAKAIAALKRTWKFISSSHSEIHNG